MVKWIESKIYDWFKKRITPIWINFRNRELKKSDELYWDRRTEIHWEQINKGIYFDFKYTTIFDKKKLTPFFYLKLDKEFKLVSADIQIDFIKDNYMTWPNRIFLDNLKTPVVAIELANVPTQDIHFLGNNWFFTYDNIQISIKNLKIIKQENILKLNPFVKCYSPTNRDFFNSKYRRGYNINFLNFQFQRFREKMLSKLSNGEFFLRFYKRNRFFSNARHKIFFGSVSFLSYIIFYGGLKMGILKIQNRNVCFKEKAIIRP